MAMRWSWSISWEEDEVVHLAFPLIYLFLHELPFTRPPPPSSPFTIAGRSFRSRLMVGTGKYRDNGEMARAIEASGAEIVTVAVRRVDLDRTKDEGISII